MRNVYIVVLNTRATVDGVFCDDQLVISRNIRYARTGNPDGFGVFSTRKCAENYIKVKKNPFAMGRDYKIVKVSVK